MLEFIRIVCNVVLCAAASLGAIGLSCYLTFFLPWRPTWPYAPADCTMELAYGVAAVVIVCYWGCLGFRSGPFLGFAKIALAYLATTLLFWHAPAPSHIEGSIAAFLVYCLLGCAAVATGKPGLSMPEEVVIRGVTSQDQLDNALPSRYPRSPGATTYEQIRRLARKNRYRR